MANMEALKITVFAKKITKKDGTKFTTYLTKLNTKSGEEISAKVMFNDENYPKPKAESCPCVLLVDRATSNLSSKINTNEETGEQFVSKTLWVGKYDISDEKFVDHSLDEFI